MSEENLTRVFGYLDNIQAAVCVTMGVFVFVVALALMLLFIWAHNYDKDTKEIEEKSKERRLSERIRYECQQDTIRMLSSFENNSKDEKK